MTASTGMSPLLGGGWKGAIIHTNTPFPMKSTTGKKWSRFRSGLLWLSDLGYSERVMETSELRRLAGLGVNVTEICEDCRCYLKGFFNALEAFRADRDLDGWALSDAMAAAARLELEDLGTVDALADYPRHTTITPELRRHVSALLGMFPTDVPAVLPIQPTDKGKVRYVIGDASAEGLGAAIQYPDGALVGRHGLWDEDFALGGSNLCKA